MYYELNEQVSSDARDATALDDGVRERVRQVVMQALVVRKVDPVEVKTVLRSVLAGIDAGLMQRGEAAGEALREAVKGMDEAVARSVFALQLALDEARGKGDEFADGDAREALSSIQDMEQDLLSTLKYAADEGKGWIKSEYTDLAAHLARTGTDTGAQVRDVMQRLGNRFSDVAQGSGADALTAASVAGTRLREVASGFLHGFADALDAGKKPAAVDQTVGKD